MKRDELVDPLPSRLSLDASQFTCGSAASSGSLKQRPCFAMNDFRREQLLWQARNTRYRGKRAPRKHGSHSSAGREPHSPRRQAEYAGVHAAEFRET